MRIGTREVGPGSPVFVIAEIGSNHGGSLDRALALIDAAADAGADAAKFQYFRVDRFLVPRPDPASLRKYELPDFWMSDLKERCTMRGIEFLCTAFDLDSLDFVDAYVDAHKIGSWEAESVGYESAVAAKGKPILFSTGRTMTWKSDLYMQATVALRCVSEYPAPIAGYLKILPGRYAGWGVSDHTLHPTIVACAAVALGACVVEKHFALTLAEGMPDSPVSINPDEFRRMCESVRLTESAVRG